MFEGIACWSERKEFLTKEDVKSRAKKALEWQIANGIQAVRTHVDVTDPELTALKAMVEVREEMKDLVTLQIVAFPQEGISFLPQRQGFNGKGPSRLEPTLSAPFHILNSPGNTGVESINWIFELAERTGCRIDVHCDEIDDEQSRFLETVATRALETGLGSKVTASHTTAMHSYNNAYTYKLFRLLKMSGINFVANPLVNIHLQGRFDTYPKRRGITRVKELNEAEINVCFGHDDIFDPWYPLGTGNMLQVLHMGLHVCQMMGVPQIENGTGPDHKKQRQGLGH